MSRLESAPGNLLIAPVVLDFRDSTGKLFHAPELAPRLHSGYSDASVALAATETILELKRHRGSADSALDIASGNMSTLTDDRMHGHNLASDFSELATDWHDPEKTIIYGFADVQSLNGHHPGKLYRGKYIGKTLIVRAEETLAPLAHELAMRAEQLGEMGMDGIDLVGGRLRHSFGQDQQRSIPLRGYTYRRKSTDLAEQRHFDDFPSCETFMAAAVLEQIELAETVVRIMPSSMQDRELSARHLLQLLGHDDLPVLSVISTKEGDVDRSIPWYNEPPGRLNDIAEWANNARSHRQSIKLAKAIHDKRFSEHHLLYDQYSLEPSESPGSMRPSEIPSFELLTERVHQVFSRTLRAAPLYEQVRIPPENVPELITDIRLLKQQFDMRFTTTGYQNQDHQASAIHYRGRGSNSVSYMQAVLASRPEIDPTTIGGSDYIQLIAHIIHEHADDAQIYNFLQIPSTSEQFLAQLEKNPPRYILLEARREAHDNAPSAIRSPI